MFKRIMLTVVSITLVTVLAFASISAVYATNEEDRIYYSDLFFGYSPDYLNDKEVENNVWERYSSLRLHTRETGDIMEKIYNDYADSFAGFWSSFKTGLNYSTDAMFKLKFKEYASLMSDTYGNTNHIYTNSLDDANMEMVKYLLETSIGDEALFGGNGTGVAAKTMKFMKDLAEFYEDIRKNYVIEKLTDYEIVEIVFEEARDDGLFIHITQTNLTLLEEVVLEDLSGYLKMFGTAAKAFEMMQTIFVGIMLEDVRMDVINDVIRASSTDYCVYDGMIRLRDKLSSGFLEYFTNSYLQPKIIDKLHGKIAEALLSPLGATYGLIGDALSIASTVVFDILFDVPDLGEMTKQKTLASYSTELYAMLRNKLLSFYGNVDSDDVRELESIFAAYIAATNAALEASKSMAKDNEYELGQIILVWEDYDYSTFIGEITDSIKDIPVAERELKDHGTIYNVKSTFRAAADVLVEDSIYLCNGVFNGSLAYNTDATIKAEDGVAPYIKGSLTITPSSYEGKSVKIPEGLTLEIGGDVKVEGNSDYYAYLRNEGTLICNGDITARSRGMYVADSTKSPILIARGNVFFGSDFVASGTIVFDGDEQQELCMHSVENIEVTNEKGIKYLDNLFLEGSFKLNGNPLDLNGFKTYLDRNATLDGSDFHEVVIRSDYTLTYDVNANVTVKASEYSGTILTIPEGEEVEINGNVTLKGNNTFSSYLRNDGTLTINGDITTSNGSRYDADPAKSPTLIVRGNVSFADAFTVDGTIVFDGDEQQEIDMSYVENIEVTNKNGIKYLDNLFLEGSFKLNGNPLDLNGFKTYLDRNATLDGSDFHEVVVRSNYTLTYDVNANVTVIASEYSGTSLTIPEGADVEINGNVTLNGNNTFSSYLRNDGTLTINGDITTSNGSRYDADPAKSPTLIVRGNVSFADVFTVYGTIVFDGDEQQEIDMTTVKNIEVTNEKGIKYLDDLYLDGSFKLNGNPLDLNGFNTYLEGNATLDGSDFHEVVIDSNYTLTCDVNANVKIVAYNYSSTIVTIPEGADVEINGNVTLKGSSDYYAYLKNNGRLTINGDITTGTRARYDAPSTNTSTLIVRGNVSFADVFTVYGTIVFDGDEQQEIDMTTVKNIEVTNKNGIKYLDDLYLDGSFKLNGNPLDLNGFNTYLEGNATLDGSDFHEVVIDSNYTLTCDVNANVKIVAYNYSSTIVTIPEGADVEINGNVTLNGNNTFSSYLRNDGTLTINGDITTSNGSRYDADPAKSPTLIVRGNVSFADAFTVDGTIVFDGDEQQEIDMSYVKNIEVTNKNGIKYLDNLYLEGSFELNGNPLDLNGFNTHLEGNATLDGSDFHDVVVRSDYTLTYDVNANVTVIASEYSGTILTIPEGEEVEINGNVTLKGNNTFSSYLRNEGTLTINGDITTSNGSMYSTDSTKSPTLIVRGNVSFADVFTVYGTIVFDGDEQQEIDMSYVKNIEVTNKNGIKYLDNLFLEGSFKLNGNPLDLNGFNTYLERNATLDGSDFHEVVVRSDYTLTYDVNANVTVIASEYSGTTLTIPEGADVEINGNVTLKGNNTFSSYLRSEGTLTINGDITVGSNSSYVDSANSVLIVTGDVIIESTRTIYGTIVFDGDDEQKTNLRYVTVIEIKNGSDAGVVFGKTINVSKLFDHKGNSFTLYNNGSGSTFVDYDGDGLKDNVDPHPTIKESEIEYTLTLKDGNDVLIMSEVYQNGEVVALPTIELEDTVNYTYTFLGWSTSPTGVVEYLAGEMITIAEDITLYAVIETKAKPVSIVVQPESVTVSNGEKVETTVVATGRGLKYTWYYTLNKNGVEFYVSSVTSATYTTTMDATRDGRKVYCVITDRDGNTVTTDVVTLSMKAGPLAITKQPTNVTAANGEKVATTVEATGEELTYTWYYTLNKNGVEFYVSSVTGATYTTTMDATRDGRKVYCVITDKYGNTVKTNTVTLSMKSGLAITKQPTNVTVANGSKVETTVTVAGEGLTYTWYYTLNKNGVEFYVSSVTSATYTTTMDSTRAGRKVYCVITDKYGNSVTTEVVTLSMDSGLTITKQPTNVTVANGSKVETTVVATGEGLKYTWYYTSNGKTNQFFVSSVTGATYTTTMDESRAGRKVYCVITDKYGNSVTTEVVTLSMSSGLAITKQPTNVTAANGEKVETTVTVAGEGLTYTWYYTSNGKTNQFFVSSVTSATYTTTMDATRDGRKVYCVITDKYGNTVTSDVVTLTMK